MPLEIGEVQALFRYPVKSMSGERLEAPSSAGTASTATGGWRSAGSVIAAGSRG